MSNKEKLIAYVASLTPEQVDKLVSRMPLLEQLKDLSMNELIYTEELLKRILCPFIHKEK